MPVRPDHPGTDRRDAAADPGPDAVPGDPLAVLEREITVLVRRSVESLWATGYGEHPDVDRYTYPVLVLLDEYGPLTLTELTGRLALTKPTVSRLVARLGRAGLVAGGPDDADPRATRVTLTRAGRGRLTAVRDARLAPLRDVLARWPDADKHALATLVGRFNTDLDAHRAAGRRRPHDH